MSFYQRQWQQDSNFHGTALAAGLYTLSANVTYATPASVASGGDCIKVWTKVDDGFSGASSTDSQQQPARKAFKSKRNLGMSASPERQRYHRRTPSSKSQTQDYSEAAARLDDEVYQSRQARLNRRSKTKSIIFDGAASDAVPASSGQLSQSPTRAAADLTPFDSRDESSSKDNMLALAKGGKLAEGGAHTSLASLFGGGAKPPPLHKVGTGPTEDEIEANEKLEKEMAATRAKWGASGEASATPPAGGVSLASLLSGRSGTNSAVADKVASRWGETTGKVSPLDSSSKSSSASPPLSTRDVPPTTTTSRSGVTTSGTSSYEPEFDSLTSFPKPTSARPLSLAAAFGSRATGPRLNQPVSNSAYEGGEGPEHARPISGARNGGTGAVAMPGMVPAGAPKPFTASPTSAPIPLPTSSSGVVEATIISRSRPAELEDDEEEEDKPSRWRPSSPSKLKSSFFSAEPASFDSKDSFAAPTSVGRPHSSSIVAERRKWSEALEEKALSTSPTKGASKRGSMYDRWQGEDADSKPSAAELQVEKEAKSFSGTRLGEALTSLEPLEPTIRSDPSPKFDSPALESSTPTWGIAMSREPSTRDRSDLTKEWSGAPIGVKEVVGYKPSSDEESTLTTNYGKGVPLPGMSPAPTSSQSKPPSSPSKPISSFSYPIPTPSTPPPRTRPISVSISKLASDSDAPRSPGGSVRDAIAMWGTTQRSIPAASLALKESYGVKISDLSQPNSPIKQKSRTQSVDLRALKAAYSVPQPESPKVVTPSLLRRPSKPAFGPSPTSPTKETHSELVKSTASSLRSTRSVELLDLLTPGAVPSTRSPGVLFSKDVLAAVDRRGILTKLWVWVGSDVYVGAEEAVSAVEKLEGVKATVVRQGQEEEKLLELLGTPLVIRKGRIHTYSEQDERLYRAELVGRSPLVDERPFAPSSLCSGFSFIAATLGDVYVWKGKHSPRAERDLAVGFAKSIAAGRPCTEITEGSEPDHFWHALGGKHGESRYASSHLWRFHSVSRPSLTLFLIAGGAPTSVTSLSPSAVAVLRSSFEHWILVPAPLKEKRSDIVRAAQFSNDTASKWKSHGLAYRPPQHILFFPTVLPLELSHLSRSLDFSLLNGEGEPKTLNVVNIKEYL
ncbi:hypothetical protein T439DRAFT_359371 [Meredithblackwellia eburnea MCA 4105]